MKKVLRPGGKELTMKLINSLSGMFNLANVFSSSLLFQWWNAF
ncbi:MAG: hypothetical protein RBR78_10295 [Flavobacteriaceae bacterium]|nr:hypothetical protein [Flavobacteriaceae bacterium]